MSQIRPTFVVCASAALISTAAYATPPELLVFNDEAYEQSDIPGQFGAHFSSFLDGFYFSANGKRWSMRANASELPFDFSTFFLSGSKNGINNIFRKNTVLNGIGFGYNGQDRPLYVNDNGDVAFSGGFSTGSFSNDEIVARYNADTDDYQIIAQEGALIPGLGGERYGPINEASGILNDGRLLYRDSFTTGPTPSNQDEWYFIGDSTNVSVGLQVGTFAPANQLGGTNNLLEGLDTHSFHVSSDTSNYIVRADIDQPTNFNCVIVNDTIVLQSGAPIAGVTGTPVSGSAVISRDDMGMNRRGDWWAFGSTTTNETYMLVNNSLYMTDGDDVPGNFGEVDFISDATISGSGDIAVLAFTTTNQWVIMVDPAGPAAPYVARYTGLLDPGSRLDLDGDPLTDDNAYLGVMSDISLGVDGTLFFLGRAFTGQGQTIGDGLFYDQVNVPSPGAAAMAGMAMLALRRGRRRN